MFATIATHRNSGMEFQVARVFGASPKDESRPIVVKTKTDFSKFGHAEQLRLNDTIEDAAVFDLVNLIHGWHFALECVHADTL